MTGQELQAHASQVHASQAKALQCASENLLRNLSCALGKNFGDRFLNDASLNATYPVSE